MRDITSTDDFIAVKNQLRHNFTLVLRNFADGPRNDDARNQYFTDAIYALDHPEMKLDFYDLLSGKVPYADYQKALEAHFEQAAQLRGEPFPEGHARHYASRFLLLRNYLREQGLIG